MQYTLTTKKVDELADVLGIDRDNIRTGYSGRGMYGRTCLGIDLDRDTEVDANQATFELAVILSDAENQGDGYDAVESLREMLYELKTHTDGMGLGTIVYWTNVSFSPDGE